MASAPSWVCIIANDSVHVWNIHGQSDPARSIRVGERTDVDHTEGPEDFLALWRREPMLNIVDIVIGQYVRHLSYRAIARAGGVAGGLPNLTAGPERCNASERERQRIIEIPAPSACTRARRDGIDPTATDEV
jgi:hypothetical protein